MFMRSHTMASPPGDRLAFGLAELAAALGVSERLVRAAVASGKIRTVAFGARRLVPREEAERLGREGLPNTAEPAK